MTIPVKFLIGLFVLSFLGAFICSFMGGGDAAINTISKDAITFANSFENIGFKSLTTIAYTSAVFLYDLIKYFGQMMLWNFAFFEGFRWIQVLLIFMNLGILVVIMVDVFRSLKPFGS
jgi:hypothetical protein